MHPSKSRSCPICSVVIVPNGSIKTRFDWSIICTHKFPTNHSTCLMLQFGTMKATHHGAHKKWARRYGDRNRSRSPVKYGPLNKKKTYLKN